jgi:hypothetical protein
MFGPKRDEVTEGWRKLRNEELLKWIRHVARMGAKRNTYRRVGGMPEGERPLGRP